MRDLLLWKDVYVGEGEGGYATLPLPSSSSSQESTPPEVKEKSRDSSAEEQQQQDTKCQVDIQHQCGSAWSIMRIRILDPH